MSEKKNYKWLGLLAILPAQGMIFMDQTILPVALPTIQREFGASDISLQWCVNSYLLLMTMFSLAGGKIGDRLGHRRGFLIGLLCFTLASIFCALSTSVNALIFSRAAQGLGAALMIPTVIALFSSLFSPHERGKATGINSSIGSLFMILGPLIGGYFTESFSWRWIFWINVPIALLGGILSLRLLPSPSSSKTKIDGFGLTYFALCSAGAVIFFMQGEKWGWFSSSSLISISITLASLFFLVRREKKTSHPFMDLSLFRRPVYAAINISISITAFILMISVFRAIYFQTTLAYTPSQAGFITFLSCLPVLFFSLIGGYLSDKVSPKLPIALGYVLIIYSFFWLGFFPTPSLTSLLVSTMIFGMGIPLIFTPSYSAAMKDLPPQKLGVAFGMVTTLRSLASTMGIALIGAFMTIFKESRVETLGERSAEIYSFSAIHFVLAFLMILAFAAAFILHRRKSTHHLPESPAEGWD